MENTLHVLKRLHVTKGLIRKHFIATAPKHAGRSLIIADKDRNYLLKCM